jgi:hypothetical protein
MKLASALIDHREQKPALCLKLIARPRHLIQGKRYTSPAANLLVMGCEKVIKVFSWAVFANAEPASTNTLMTTLVSPLAMGTWATSTPWRRRLM